MDDKGNNKRHLQMGVEFQNDDLELSKASTSNYVEEKSQDSEHFRQGSPIFAEDMLKDTFSNLSLNIHKESDSCKEELPEIPASTKKKISKLMLPNTPSGNGESIYNLRKSFKNPVTGIVTKIGADQALSQGRSVCKQDNASTSAFTTAKREVTSHIVGDGSRKKLFELRKNINPKQYTPRNPITGDGIEMIVNCPSKKPRILSGTRATQPSGGKSSNIF